MLEPENTTEEELLVVEYTDIEKAFYGANSTGISFLPVEPWSGETLTVMKKARIIKEENLLKQLKEKAAESESSNKEDEKTLQEHMDYLKRLFQTQSYQDLVLKSFANLGVKPPEKMLKQLKRMPEDKLQKPDQINPNNVQKISTEDLQRMKVGQLKEEMKKRGIPIPSKAVKADLEAFIRLHADGKLNQDKTSPSPKRSSKRRKTSSYSYFTDSDEEEESSEEEEEEEELDVNDKSQVLADLLDMTEHCGTVGAYLVYHLRKILCANPGAKVVVWSRNLSEVQRLLEINHISCTIANVVEIRSLSTKSSQNKLAKYRKMCHLVQNNNVLLLDSISNTIDASHLVVLGEELISTNKITTHGQLGKVKISRIVVKDRPEYSKVLERNPEITVIDDPILKSIAESIQKSE